MSILLEAEEFLQQAKLLPIIDVRSPAEWESGHIPGAINIPIFTNDERAKVGTRYKQSGKEQAIEMGLEFVGPKMLQFVKEAKKIAKDKRVLLHCWRGGMRSKSMAWLFELAGLETIILKGGYKAYRNYIREQFNKPANLIVLGGFTGSGKTDILKEIEKLGQQFLDIESIARLIFEKSLEESISPKGFRFLLHLNLSIKEISQMVQMYRNLENILKLDSSDFEPILKNRASKIYEEIRNLREQILSGKVIC